MNMYYFDKKDYWNALSVVFVLASKTKMKPNKITNAFQDNQ